MEHSRREFFLLTGAAVPVLGQNRVAPQWTAWGPARGDLAHWRYETVDIRPFLQAGKNVLAAVAWNFSKNAPEAQIFYQTGFLLQGPAGFDAAVSSSASWKCIRNESYIPIPKTTAQMRGYFVAGPGDRVDAARYPWG
jgi:hypothetical protein